MCGRCVLLLMISFFLSVYGRWVRWYVRRERTFRYAGLCVQVPPGVFHPGLYGSTPLFLRFLHKMSLSGKKVLEMGTGSGLPAIFAARKGAAVTAVDVSEAAVRVAQANALRNGVIVQVLHSDLWSALPPERFDLVLVNPPYFDKEPAHIAEAAFFAGAGLHYFDRFFEGVFVFLAPAGEVWMILSEKCALPDILSKATQRGFEVRILPAGYWWTEQFFMICFYRQSNHTTF